MECTEAGPFVSALYDGEPVPKEAADHIDGCAICRTSLDSYSQMGAELRLLASRTAARSAVTEAVLKRLRVPEKTRWFAFLRRPMLVPRLAMLMAAIALAGVSAGLIVVRAQSQARSYWFQFKLAPAFVQPGTIYHVARAGTDDGFFHVGVARNANGRPMITTSGEHELADTEMQAIGTHYAVSSIEDGQVELRIRCHRYNPGDLALFKKENLVLDGHKLTYTPGQSLVIPVEGGGTLVLTGQIMNSQPKLAWGLPLEPNPEQLVLTNPVVIHGNTVLANMGGLRAVADGPTGVELAARGLGQLTIGLQPFSGAVQAQANWGELTFQWNGKSYRMLSASPISGGEQPHAVWVTLDPEYMRRSGSREGLGGTGRLQ